METTLKAGITFGALLAERFSWFLAGIKFGVLLAKIVQKPSIQSFLAGVKFGVLLVQRYGSNIGGCFL